VPPAPPAVTSTPPERAPRGLSASAIQTPSKALRPLFRLVGLYIIGEPRDLTDAINDSHDMADPITCPPDVCGEQVTPKGYVTDSHFGTKDFAVPNGSAYP